MKECLTFKTIMSDTQFWQPGSELSSRNFFEDEDNTIANVNTDTVTKPVEPQIVKWLLRSNTSLRSLFFEELNLPSDTVVGTEVKKPFIIDKSKIPGDIDALFVDPSNLNTSTAFQFKRCVEENGELIVKQKVIREITPQANGTREFGFNRTIAGFIIPVDASHEIGKQIIFRRPSNNTLKLLIDFPGRDELHNDIGIWLIPVIQPSNKNYKHQYHISIAELKAPASLEQPTELKTKLEEFIRRKSH